MKIETSRFIMEELSSEDKTEYFAQISEKMVWKDTIEILLDEKKLEVYIKNLAQKDLSLSLQKKQKITDSLLQNSSFSDKRIKKQQSVFKNFYQQHMLNIFTEKSRERVLAYRKQIIEEIKNKLGIDFENDVKAFKKFKNTDFAKIKNENLNPPIPIDDWYYNIQFLKPNFKEIDQVQEDVLWFKPVDKYVKDGIEANKDKDSGFFYFKITDKASGQVVGISRICTKAKTFIVNYDKNNKPITQICVGDPGIFLDTAYQGAGRGSEIYATTLNVLYNFLLKEEDKTKDIIIKCNRLNEASKKLQVSIGAKSTNENRPINNRFYFTVTQEKMHQSECWVKLKKLKADVYTISTDDTTYEVSLQDGILRTQKNHSKFFRSLQNMMQKTRLCKVQDKPKETVIGSMVLAEKHKKLDNLQKTK